MYIKRYSRLARCMGYFMLFSLFISCAPKVKVDADKLLAAALHDVNVENRLKAVQALKELESGNTVNALLTVALYHEDEIVRVRAVKALGIIGSDGAVDALEKIISQSENTLVRSDLANYESVYQALTDALSDEDEFVRTHAEKSLEAIKNIGLDTDTIDRMWLVALLDIRCYAVQAMYEAGSVRAAKSLVTAVAHEITDIHNLATHALIKIKNPT